MSDLTMDHVYDEFRFNGQGIPDYMQAPLMAYLEKHQRPGGFLSAVLSNDLLTACEKADQVNLMHLPVYVAFLYNHAPSGSWGSPENFVRWIEQ